MAPEWIRVCNILVHAQCRCENADAPTSVQLCSSLSATTCLPIRLDETGLPELYAPAFHAVQYIAARSCSRRLSSQRTVQPVNLSTHSGFYSDSPPSLVTRASGRALLHAAATLSCTLRTFCQSVTPSHSLPLLSLAPTPPPPPLPPFAPALSPTKLHLRRAISELVNVPVAKIGNAKDPYLARQTPSSSTSTKRA